MDVKEAIERAKTYLKDVYQGEGIKNVGLEEINLREGDHCWYITLGFSRPWEQDEMSRMFGRQLKLPARSYKIVRVDDESGKIISIRHRDVQLAE